MTLPSLQLSGTVRTSARIHTANLLLPSSLRRLAHHKKPRIDAESISQPLQHGKVNPAGPGFLDLDNRLVLHACLPRQLPDGPALRLAQLPDSQSYRCHGLKGNAEIATLTILLLIGRGLLSRMENGRARQALTETATAKNWHLRFLEATAVLIVTYAGLTWYSPGDRAENLVLGLAAGVAVLLVVPLVECAWHYVKLGRPIGELHRAISNQLLTNGPAEIRLKQALEADGVSFVPLHVVALRALDANGQIRKIQYHIGFDELGTTQIIDAFIEPVLERFPRV